MSFFGVLKGLFNNVDPVYLKVDNEGSVFTLPQSIVSTLNTTTSSLSTGQSWSGSGELNTYRDAMVVCKTDADGIIYFDLSPDGINWDSSLSASISSGSSEFHIIEKGPRIYRTRLSSSGDQSFLRLYTYYGEFRQGNLPLNSNISSDADATLTRSVLVGSTDNGKYINVPVDGKGHIAVTLQSPKLPFGSIHNEKLTPVFQSDSVYGLNPFLTIPTTGSSFGTGSNSGTVSGNNNLFKCSTGTTQFSFSTIQSRRRLRYRPGQGVIGRFAGFFSASIANSIVVAGFGTAESGFYFGYNGTSYGILHSTGGVRELHTFTITTPSTAGNPYLITLPNGITSSISSSNNSSTTHTAYEISKGNFPGWKALSLGSKVLFLSNSVGAVSGSFSLSQPSAGVPAVGSDAETTPGISGSDTWYPQEEWNLDRMNGSNVGSSGIILDPTKGNIYQMDIQYLGFGSIVFKIEAASDNTNSPGFVNVHSINFPNTSQVVHTSQPSFPFTMAAYSAGSNKDVSVSVGSFAGFIEGDINNIGPRMSYRRESGVTSTTSGYTPLFTVKNSLVFNGRANQSVSHLINIGGAAKSNTGLTTFYLIKDANLQGEVNFTSYASSSTTNWDITASSCTYSSEDQVVWSGTVSETGDFNYAFKDDEITLQPGESITLAVKSVTSTANCVGSLNTREDQ